MYRTRPSLERHEPRYGGPAHTNDIMSIQSVLDAPPVSRNEITHSTWGYETPGGFYPRPYGRWLTVAQPCMPQSI